MTRLRPVPRPAAWTAEETAPRTGRGTVEARAFLPPLVEVPAIRAITLPDHRGRFRDASGNGDRRSMLLARRYAPLREPQRAAIDLGGDQRRGRSRLLFERGTPRASCSRPGKRARRCLLGCSRRGGGARRLWCRPGGGRMHDRPGRDEEAQRRAFGSSTGEPRRGRPRNSSEGDASRVSWSDIQIGPGVTWPRDDGRRVPGLAAARQPTTRPEVLATGRPASRYTAVGTGPWTTLRGTGQDQQHFRQRENAGSRGEISRPTMTSPRAATIPSPGRRTARIAMSPAISDHRDAAA